MPTRIIALSDLTQFTAVNLLSDPGNVPGPVVVPQCAQISVVWSMPDQKLAHNVLYGRYAGTFAGSVAQANSIMTAITTGAAWTALAAFIVNTNGVLSVQIRDVNQPNQAIIASTNAAVTGTSASPALPNEVALVATLRTALTGRQNRGRMYVPNFATNALGTGNTAAAAVVTAVTNWVDGFRAIFTANGYTFVIGQKARAAYTSPVTGRQFPARAATSQAVTAAVCKDGNWDSQRRRGLK